MQHLADARRLIGCVFIGFGAVFVLYVTTTYCFSTQTWLLGGSDGTYSYLLNGLNVATLHSVGHTDHPGTVLQILCGVWPEILIPSLFLLLTLVTLKRWREDSLDVPVPSRTLALMAGILTGAALFTKITFFPIFGASFFFWKDKKSRWCYILGFACVMLICVPFFWDLLGRTVSWFIGLALHAGHYGSGQATIVDPATFYANIREIISSNIPIAGLFVMTLCGLLIFRNERHKLGWKMPALYTLAVAILIVIAAKHYMPRYLLPIILTCFFMPLICCTQLKRGIPSKIVVCIICCLFIFSSSYKLYTNSTVISRFSGNYANYDDNIFQGKNIVESYNTYTISYGFSLGSAFSKNRHGELLREIYPNIFDYNIWNKQFYHFGKHVSFEEIASRGPVMIRGNNLKGPPGEALILGEKIASFPEGDMMYELRGEKKQK